jgi:hypothetical protein
MDAVAIQLHYMNSRYRESRARRRGLVPGLSAAAQAGINNKLSEMSVSSEACIGQLGLELVKEMQQ